MKVHLTDRWQVFICCGVDGAFYQRITEYTSEVTCKRCMNTVEFKRRLNECVECHGEGKHIHHTVFMDGARYYETKCDSCNGTGKKSNDRDTTKDCNGIQDEQQVGSGGSTPREERRKKNGN